MRLISKIAIWTMMSLYIIVASIAPTNATEKTKTDPQILCLAKNIYFEARNETFEGMVAVAQVTLNRVKHNQFPNSICKVVYQKTRSNATNKIVCQFSWVCQDVGSPRYSSYKWQDCVDIATNVVHHDLKLISLASSLYYHNIHVKPGWNLERLTKIGNHIFYSDAPAKKSKK